MTTFDLRGARILFDARWSGPQGIARVGRELLRRLPEVEPLTGGLPLFHPLEPLWLTYRIRRAAPDVYFSPGFNVPLKSASAFVFMLHDLNYIHCPENSDWRRRAYLNLLVRPACAQAARVLTVSEFSRKQIIEWAGVNEGRVQAVPPGVDSSFEPTGPRFDEGYPYVLYVGNRLAHKNLPRLFSAFATVQRDVKLLLTGNMDRETVSLARKHGVEESVRFAGQVSDKDLPALYRGARLLAFPSLFEGFGLPVLEAMACGVPVLTSSATSLPEVAGDAALLVDPASTDAIATGLKQLLTDETLRDELVEKGLLRAAMFNWDTTAQQVRSVLEEIV